MGYAFDPNLLFTSLKYWLEHYSLYKWSPLDFSFVIVLVPIQALTIKKIITNVQHFKQVVFFLLNYSFGFYKFLFKVWILIQKKKFLYIFMWVFIFTWKLFVIILYHQKVLSNVLNTNQNLNSMMCENASNTFISHVGHPQHIL